MNNNSPCNGCKTRSPTCHGSCEAYNAFAEQRERDRQQRYKIKTVESALYISVARNKTKK